MSCFFLQSDVPSDSVHERMFHARYERDPSGHFSSVADSIGYSVSSPVLDHRRHSQCEQGCKRFVITGLAAEVTERRLASANVRNLANLIIDRHRTFHAGGMDLHGREQ